MIGLLRTVASASYGGTTVERLRRLQPDYLLESPLVLDGATNQAIDLSALSGSATATMAWRFDLDVTGTTYTISGDVVDFAFQQAPGSYWRMHVGGSSNYADISVASGLTPHYMVSVFDGSGAGNPDRLRVWVDGVEQTGASITHSGTIPAAVPTLTTSKIGSRSDDSFYFIGTISVMSVWASNELENIELINEVLANA